ncbi:hypothetical protein ACFE04_020769 [Oxalis oulophora]
MDVIIDHYAVLGLPSGDEGTELTDKEISKAYKLKALELHPDKRPDDPNAHDNFQKLQSSYAVLRDEKARKLFDNLLKVKREHKRRQTQRQAHHDSKRRKMMSDLENREREAEVDVLDPTVEALYEEERIARKLKEEMARIREMIANKMAKETTTKMAKEETTTSGTSSQVLLDKEKVLKVYWKKIGDYDYNAEFLRHLFSRFGKVDHVVIMNSKKRRGTALVLMASKDASVAATRNILGNRSNPLLVVPLQPSEASEVSNSRNLEPAPLNNLVGADFQAFEDSVLAKLQKRKQEDAPNRNVEKAGRRSKQKYRELDFAHLHETFTSRLIPAVTFIGLVVIPVTAALPLLDYIPHHNVNLLSIFVNGQILPISSSLFQTTSNQGTIVDSGTTLAYLPPATYDPFVNAVQTIPVNFYCFLLRNKKHPLAPGFNLLYHLLRQNIVLKDRTFVYDLAGQQIGWANYDCLMQVNVSATINTRKSEFVNAGQISNNSSPKIYV